MLHVQYDASSGVTMHEEIKSFFIQDALLASWDGDIGKAFEAGTGKMKFRIRAIDGRACQVDGVDKSIILWKDAEPKPEREPAPQGYVSVEVGEIILKGYKYKSKRGCDNWHDGVLRAGVAATSRDNNWYANPVVRTTDKGAVVTVTIEDEGRTHKVVRECMASCREAGVPETAEETDRAFARVHEKVKDAAWRCLEEYGYYYGKSHPRKEPES